MNPIMHIEMTEGGVIDIELFPEITPNSVRSIIWLVNKGWYDNRIFYRVVKDFVLQTDCDKRPGIYEEGCDYIIDGEYKNSGHMVEQPSFKKYYVGMAGCGGDSNISAGSQFFIMTGDHERLDGDFPVIGKVVGGFDVVDRINETPCNEKLIAGNIKFYTPKTPQRMKHVWVDTFGVEYEAPVTREPDDKYRESELEIDSIIDWA